MKEFNITGMCIPEMHYMVNTQNKIDEIMKLIEKRKYFALTRPRQYGKTTTLFLLEKTLEKNNEYLVISISFEGIGDAIFKEEERFVRGFTQIIADRIFFNDEELAQFLESEKNKIQDFNDLSRLITRLIKKANKKVILMIDEVDKGSNNQLFLSFLGMLRNKYLFRNEGEDFTFHSVVLAGVHDIKSLRINTRLEEEHKYDSPWNIAADFEVDMSFSPQEIMTMLDDYCEDKNVEMDKKYFADKLYYYTFGYPFLVSKICKIIDEKILISDREDNKVLYWKNEYLERAIKLLLQESNTNFDNLIKNLENNIELYEIVKNIIIGGIKIGFNIYNPIINWGNMHGIFKNENGILKINNRLYEQLIYDYMLSKIQAMIDFDNYNFKEEFITSKGTFNLRQILLKFQQFMKKEHSEKLRKFLENDGRLVFLAFLNPIINGTSFAFKEVQTSEEKRLDITITYGNEMNIIETKIWRGEKEHQKGVEQLYDYLEINNLDRGYLLIFDFRKERHGEVEELEVKEKKIFVVCV